MAANSHSKYSLFVAAKAAVFLVTLIGVIAGIILSVYIPTEWLQRVVAFALIAIGVSMLRGKL